MSTILLHNAELLITMDDERTQIRNGALFIRDNVIEWVGPTQEASSYREHADRILDASNKVVLPGLINTHHHFFQTLTRTVAPNCDLYTWLKTLYPLWTRLDPQAVYISTLTAVAELILSGCTTTVDHLYLFPDGTRLEDEIRAARQAGVRFHAARGAISMGESDGGLAPDSLVEDESEALKDMRRVIEAFHDPQEYAMLRIAIAPCSLSTVTPAFMRASAELARAYGTLLHTHLGETESEVLFCTQKFGCRPVSCAEQTGWLGEDVWWAHAVHLDDVEIELMRETRTGVAHCPSSNMRLASGIAPVQKMLAAGIPFSLGVDGSASNDSSHLLAEARMALLMQRVLGGPTALTAEEVLWSATRGGASVLRRDDVGQLSPGKAADVIAFALNSLGYAGATHHPLAALLFCAPAAVDLSIINGEVVVEDGELRTIDIPLLVEKHNAISRRILSGN